MRVSEIFESIQGEGRYAGIPSLFIRLSGCTRNCDFCDTKYHIDGLEMNCDELAERINKSDKKIVVWTGGEPMIQAKEMLTTIYRVQGKSHHLETNGDVGSGFYFIFDYICVSPKNLAVAKKLSVLLSNYPKSDVKVVTDLSLNEELIPYATMLMPLTVDYGKKDNEIERNVWEYCIKHNIRFCLRQHAKVWGKKKRK